MSTPASPQGALGRAANLLRQRDLAGAEAACREVLVSAPRHAAALHLLGLIRKEAGDVRDAERLMRESIAAAPAQPEFLNNLANLLRREGRVAEAIAAYREALSASPNHRLAQIGLARALNDAGDHAAAEVRARELIATDARNPAAWSLLAAALRDQQRFAEAESAASETLRLAPAEPSAHHEFAAVMASMDRAERAIDALARAEALGLRGFELALTRGAALLQLYRIEEAERWFGEAVALQPLNAEAQLRLANLRFMRGDAAFARDLRAAATAGAGDVNLQMLLGKVLRRAGDHAAAEALLRDVMARVGPAPEVRIALAEVLLEQGRLKEAEVEATEAAANPSLDRRLLDVLVTILLCRGRAKDATPFIRAERTRRPHSQTWIAHEATAARLSGDSLYHEINDYARLVQSYDLESPPGWSSMAELNAAALVALDKRHVFARAALDQPVRNGSRTVRNLSCEADAALKGLLHAFELALAEYVQVLGRERAHPLSARNEGGARLDSAWSTQLRPGGFCLNHIRAQGWISATYYVAAATQASDETQHSGCLKFGEPRHPTPGAGAEGVVQPRAGRLVLFPSYMWRGTTPQLGSEPQTSISFDALPAART